MLSNHLMKTYSSVLAWRIPWTEEPGRLQSMGSQRVWHDWSDWAQAQHRPIESVVLSNHLILCLPLLLLSSIFPSIRVFSNELALPIRWPTIRSSASASVFPMSIYSWFPLGLTGLISLQSKELLGIFSSSKVSILGHSAFFMVQLSYLYMTTGNTIALTIQTFVSKVMSLLFNILYRFIIVFLIRSKCLLISWL